MTKNKPKIAISIILGLFLFIAGISPAFAQSREGTKIFASGMSSNNNVQYVDYDIWNNGLTFDQGYPCHQQGSGQSAQYQIYWDLWNNAGTSHYNYGTSLIEPDWGNGYNQKAYHLPVNYIPGDGSYFFQIKCGESPNWQQPIFYINFTVSNSVVTPESQAVNGACGSANNQTYRALPTDSGVLCSAGTPTSSIFSFDSGWLWTCEGINGGSTDVCHATFDNAAPSINATCGSDDGQTLSSPPTNLCANGDLITPSFISTQTGWTWTCAGVDGGYDANCSASNSTFVFPTIPAPIDCSSLAVPEKWFCDITNIIKGIFLPSDSAKKALSDAADGIKQKAPFCYIAALQSDLVMLQVAKNTTGSSVNMSFGWGSGSSGTIDLDTFGSSGTIRDLIVYIRAIISFVIILIFIFWILGYMKRVFK